MMRLLRIARREFLAYVRTPGFWLQLMLLPVGLSAIVFAPMAMSHSAPVPRVAVVDFTGGGFGAVVARSIALPDDGGKPHAVEVTPPGAPFASPADAAARLRPYLEGNRRLPGGGELDAVAIIQPAKDTVALDFWSRNVATGNLERVISDSVGVGARLARLRSLGIDDKTLQSVEAMSPVVSDFSPKTATGKVAFKDRLPGYAGLAMGILLWMVVLTGAGMLLNSVMEEKTSRILEVLLTSASRR